MINTSLVQANITIEEIEAIQAYAENNGCALEVYSNGFEIISVKHEEGMIIARELKEIAETINGWHNKAPMNTIDESTINSIISKAGIELEEISA